ncbi:serine/threonine protein kinase [Paenibacillus endoradicis]|uniref:serine/threonine protein kinase n=1 Tax=Paenibacillus endoradicis TaxID=2972487 RepID=UPI0021592F14|nr:serine/threonine-protein kinase [Paenibacillus endoradicis]MCR8656843.1 serine/threonine protein kinase [Paenibacillus endoradicis]
MRQLTAGTVIAERYVVVDYVTEGGMGQLYKVRDLRLEGVVRAMKVLKQELINDTASVTISNPRDSEAKLLTLLHHQGLPTIYDHFQANEYHDEIIVMEWIEGQHLERFCLEQKMALSLDLLLSMSIQLIEAIQYLHEQKPPIIHRDIKPSNVMVSSIGQIKLIDFGISKLHRSGSFHQTMAFGTPGFAAPEQMKGLPTDERSDLYSYGCILYYLCTGGKQIANQYDLQQIEYTIKREMSHIPKAIRHLVLQCLQPNPQYRIFQASEVRAQLLQLVPVASSYTSEKLLFKTKRIKTIGVFSLNSQAGATTIALLMAQHYGLNNRVKYVEYCGYSTCLESIPVFQKVMLESNGVLDEVEQYYKVVTIDHIEHYVFRSRVANSISQAEMTFEKIINADSSVDYQFIDYSSGWSAEQMNHISDRLDFVILVSDPTIIMSNERNFRNIQHLLITLEDFNIPYTWINNKDTNFSGRKSWNALNNGREIYSISLLSAQDMYSAMWSQRWLTNKSGAINKLRKKLMPLINTLNSTFQRID